MARNNAFENLTAMKKTYGSFNLETKKFTANKNSKHSGGVPLMYESDTKNLHIDSSDTHSLVFGSTGSLKTRTVVSPTIKILGYAGESMVINDPKGELFVRHAGDLAEQGYNIVEINFRNPSLGNAWNPLYIPYKFYLDGDYDKAAEFVNDIATNLMLSETLSKDPFWEYSASDVFYGLVMLLFRYCKEFNEPMTAVNIGNVLGLRRKLYSQANLPSATDIWKYASQNELITISLSGSVYAPKDTRNSILSTFDQKMRSFSIQDTLLEMLSNNDFSMEKIQSEKTAVFLITPDEKTSYHRLVSMFIKECYEYLIYEATMNSDNKMKVRVNFILDEFSSLPKIADMPAMISAARSRDIKFLLVVQSQSSLKQRYAEEADTIVANCTNWIFFTSRELALLKEISELCGQRNDGSPNISVYDLQHFSKDRREALVLSGRLNPARVQMLDIDKFGDKSYAVLEHKKLNRVKRIWLKFDFVAKEKTTNIDDMIDNIDSRIQVLEDKLQKKRKEPKEV